MEGIRVGGAKARNRSARLCPGGRVFRMGMAHAAYAGECFIENQVRRQIGRRPQLAFDDFSVQVRDDQVRRLHPFIGNAARLDDHESLFPGNAAGITKREEHQPLADQLKVGFQDFAAKVRQQHRFGG